MSLWESHVPMSLWELHCHGAHVPVRALSSCPTLLWGATSSLCPSPCGSPVLIYILVGATFSWCPRPCGAHILVVLTSSWCSHPRGAHVLVVPPSLWDSSSHAHIFVPMSSWNPSTPGCSIPNPGCLGHEQSVLTEPRWYQERWQSHQHLAVSLQRPC